MLVRMKLRDTKHGSWREKWARASLKVKGILAIQRVVKFERAQRKQLKQMEQDLYSEMMHGDDIDEYAIRQDTHSGSPMKSNKKRPGYNYKN